jgi:hypothetical protein
MKPPRQLGGLSCSLRPRLANYCALRGTLAVIGWGLVVGRWAMGVGP